MISTTEILCVLHKMQVKINLGEGYFIGSLFFFICSPVE